MLGIPIGNLVYRGAWLHNFTCANRPRAVVGIGVLKDDIENKHYLIPLSRNYLTSLLHVRDQMQHCSRSLRSG